MYCMPGFQSIRNVSSELMNSAFGGTMDGFTVKLKIRVWFRVSACAGKPVCPKSSTETVRYTTPSCVGVKWREASARDAWTRVEVNSSAGDETLKAPFVKTGTNSGMTYSLTVEGISTRRLEILTVPSFEKMDSLTSLASTSSSWSGRMGISLLSSISAWPGRPSTVGGLLGVMGVMYDVMTRGLASSFGGMDDNVPVGVNEAPMVRLSHPMVLSLVGRLYDEGQFKEGDIN
mmetsp:Transcript_25812/g.65667  ORF Transcript_25812/g.65667 Transcript_25812/m.65667 type:complete len:232 (-) Transcript_25812:487-1182(-)